MEQNNIIELVNKLDNGQRVVIPVRYRNTKRNIYLTMEEQLLGEMNVLRGGYNWKTHYSCGKYPSQGIRLYFTMDKPFDVFSVSFHTDKLLKEICKVVEKHLGVSVATYFRTDYLLGEKIPVRELKNKTVVNYEFVPPKPKTTSHTRNKNNTSLITLAAAMSVAALGG